MNTFYATVIKTFISKCIEAGIPFTFKPLHDGGEIRFSWCSGTIAIFFGTHESCRGRLESYGFPWDDGRLSTLKVDTAFDFLKIYYEDEMAARKYR